MTTSEQAPTSAPTAPTATDEQGTCYTFIGTMTALSSITHFGDSVGGTEQVLRREKVIQPNGTIEEVPLITGNSLRGQLRDAGMRRMLDRLRVARGLERLELSPTAFHFLFSGGALSTSEEQSLNIEAARRLRSLIPLVGLLGGATKGQIMQGKLTVEKIIPICRETAHVLPTHFAQHPMTTVSVYDLTTIEHYTRMDDAKRESLAGTFLAPPEQRLLEAPKTRKVTNKQTGEVEEVAEAPGKATQMRYGWEVFAAGTVFSCGFYLSYVTPLEFEAFADALAEWSRNPVLGGRSSIGHGRVRYESQGWFSATPSLTIGADAQAVSTETFGERYERYLSDHAERIIGELESLA